MKVVTLCCTMDVRISRIFTDWYGFSEINSKNPYESVKIREIRTSIVQ
ncbi:MAG: hypothetical protein RL329_4157 [Bacteroidota bacterium]|jgi:hypothetical protein